MAGGVCPGSYKSPVGESPVKNIPCPGKAGPIRKPPLGGVPSWCGDGACSMVSIAFSCGDQFINGRHPMSSSFWAFADMKRHFARRLFPRHLKFRPENLLNQEDIRRTLEVGGFLNLHRMFLSTG